jgi:hypothetical protein
MKRALETLFMTCPAFSHHLQDASHANSKANGLARLLESSSIMIYAGMLLVSYCFKLKLVWLPIEHLIVI